MILVHCSRTEVGQNWANALKKEFGDAQVVLSSDHFDKNEIDIAICWKAPNRMLHDFPNLKLIQSLGAGVDHIFDTDNAIPSAVISRIIDPQLSEDMYEFVLACILNDMKQLTHYRDQQNLNAWSVKPYRTISEVTVSVLGLGVIGTLVSTKLSALGFKVMGWSKSEKSIQNVQSFVGETGLDKMLGMTDYLVNILPLTDDTRSFINHSLLSKLKKGAYLINVGRGPHLVDNDLLQALEEELISGAALDVFHNEPLEKTNPFWSHPKVVLTPHVASITNIETARAQVFENIRRFQSGRPVLNQVSHSKAY